MDLGSIFGNLLTPPVLFFGLGAAGTLLKSDLEIPQPVTRGLSLYLLFAIGLHGGYELANAGLSLEVLTPLIAGMVSSVILPIPTFLVLKKRLGVPDAAAIAATYGSISAVTFITACSFLNDKGVAWSGTMVAAMALMESPAILIGVVLARLASRKNPDAGEGDRGGMGALLHEAFLNGPVLLLVGSLLIGFVCGEDGWKSVKPFVKEPFKGVLCLFLLDMGLIAARRLNALKKSGPLLVGYSVVVPMIHAAIAIFVAKLIGLSVGDALLFTVLCASASYIAVPAAVRMTLPKANPSLFLPMSLAMTFPFNVAIGIPLYMAAIEAVWGIS